MKSVYLIGAGNVAWHLALAFKEAPQINLAGIWSRDIKKSEALAEACQTRVIPTLQALEGKQGLVLIAVPDSAIAEIVEQLPSPTKAQIVAHTSGATRMNVFPEKWPSKGVFYPLQTLTKFIPVDFKGIPLLTSSDKIDVHHILNEYASAISSHVIPIDDEVRPHVHLAAVFINNFVHNIGVKAFTYLENKGLDKKILYPLLIETVRKLQSQNLEGLQTGPAIRNDVFTIEAHLRLLGEETELANLYRQLSLSINPNLPL